MRPLRRRRVSVLTAAVVLALTLAGCTAAVDGSGSIASTDAAPSRSGQGSASGSSGATPSTTPDVPRASFRDCRSAFNLDVLTFPAGREKRLSFSCATVNVPLDYADPSGRTVGVTIVKVHDSANTAHTGSLLVNPGGPGASGIELGVSLAAQVSDSLLAHFDLIGFDPRGVGQSSPITCATDAQKDTLNASSPDVLTAAGRQQAKNAARTFADTCNRRYGSALAQYNTVNTARDMDEIRQAVGDKQMNYLGFSYGTELGSTYAHLFPKNIRVMVLDGAVNPLTSDIASFANQLQGFEDSFDQFAKYCTGNASCQAIGNPRQAVAKILATAAKTPIPSSTAGETRKATKSLVETGVLSALYSQSLWSSLGQALASALHGDSAGLLTLADRYNERDQDGHYSNLSDANSTISCNDSKPGPSDATILATAKSWQKRFPIFGLTSAASLYGCQVWQSHRTPVPLPSAKTTPTKVLVIGNLNDPATPYQGAKDLTRTMGNAELLSWDGEGHTSYLQGSTCIDKDVDNYLVSKTLPPANTTCPR